MQGEIIMIDIIKYLKENKNVHDFKIITTEKKSSELFFVHKNLETVRRTDTNEVLVTIYNYHDEKIGQAEFSLFEADDSDAVKEKINIAVSKAKLIGNELYELPGCDVKSIEVESNFKNYSLNELAELISNSVFEADSYKDGSINALEVFVNQYERTIINSKGLNKVMKYYDAFVEAIPTWNGNNESVELYEAYKFNEFNSKKVKEEIDSKMTEVKNRFYAKKPESKLSMKVALRANELNEFLSEIIFNANSQTIYTHQNVYNMGDNIQAEAKGDKLTITARGEIKGCALSRSFDSDGLDLIDTKVMEKGILKAIYGGNRFSQYLKVTPTGNLGLIEVEKGKTSIKDLKEPYFECVSLSGLQVDLFTDYIGGEVRLGYVHENGEIKPVTGISISGKISEILKDMTLSKETTIVDNYSGPKLALFGGLEIL